jgi:hypothetical protein
MMNAAITPFQRSRAEACSTQRPAASGPPPVSTACIFPRGTPLCFPLAIQRRAVRVTRGARTVARHAPLCDEADAALAASSQDGGPAYPWIATISGMTRIATTFVILIMGLIAGPAVSL